MPKRFELSKSAEIQLLKSIRQSAVISIKHPRTIVDGYCPHCRWRNVRRNVYVDTCRGSKRLTSVEAEEMFPDSPYLWSRRPYLHCSLQPGHSGPHIACSFPSPKRNSHALTAWY
jgi:hypothetical protein